VLNIPACGNPGTLSYRSIQSPQLYIQLPARAARNNPIGRWSRFPHIARQRALALAARKITARDMPMKSAIKSAIFPGSALFRFQSGMAFFTMKEGRTQDSRDAHKRGQPGSVGA
jgi:hypothetical protein